MNLSTLIGRLNDYSRKGRKNYCAVTIRNGDRIILQLRRNIDFTSSDANDIITVSPIIYTTHEHLRLNRRAILEALNSYLGTNYKRLIFDSPEREF